MTPDRHAPDASPDFRDEFWGEQAEWTPQRTPPTERSGLGATIGRWWGGVLGAGADTARAHGRPVAPSPPDEYLDAPTGPRRDLGDADGDRHVDHVDADDSWTVEPERSSRRRAGGDPLLARFGGLAVIITLAAPLIVGFTAAGADGEPGESLLASVSTDASTIDSITTDPNTTESSDASSAANVGAVAATTETPSPEPAPADAPAVDAGVPTSSDAESRREAAAPVAAASLDDASDPEPGTSTPTVTMPVCASRYELAGGDYWIRIADAAGVSLADVLAVNGASIDTVLVPGRSICLPAGASTPAPPATTAPTAPAATATPTRPPATTVVPARPAPTPATTAPATTVPARPAAVPASQAAAIIREVWPDDLEERALEIAWRESNHRSNVNNSCCYGLFQIHWTAHRTWLATMGVTSASQLFDPAVNANVAYALYQRSGGFGPWGG